MLSHLVAAYSGFCLATSTLLPSEAGSSLIAGFAITLGLVPCFTSVRCPTAWPRPSSFKRDYIYVHDCPDARTVLSQLPRWFEDYNEIHPHKALQLKSPREFIRSHPTAASPI